MTREHPHAVPHSHPVQGLTQGILHPLLGIDHLLAMLAVGLLAAQFAGRQKWYAPACFVGGLIAGGALGLAGIQFSYMEVGIAISLICLGCALAVGKRLHLAAVLFASSAFGVFHGYAHGVEANGSTSTQLLFMVGMLITTILLQLAGVGLGDLARRSSYGTVSLRISGIIVTALGMFLLAMMEVH